MPDPSTQKTTPPVAGPARGASPPGRDEPPAARPPADLPLQLSSFVGRGREIREVKRLLLSGARLLTLTGAGGCGKTRLALAVANGLVEEFEDGVWLVELASLADPDLVLQAVASALGVCEQPSRPLAETLTDALGEKRLLVVLDNCEHLLGASARLAETLLRACPGLRILATSREALGVGGEVSYPVPPLSSPGLNLELPTEEVARYEAVRLFVERAAAALPGFALTEGNAPAVAEVCRRLDGMPLAIELAAARVRVLSVGQISERLDECFRVLKTGSQTALPRQRTLRATIDWSYELLSGGEKALLRRLSVFAGGFTLGAAEEVCAGEGLERDDVLELLSHLVDKSLVLVAEQGGESRYRLLETVRQYAKGKFDTGSGEEAATRRRHALFFLKLAETAEAAMSGAAQEGWVERLEVEHDNLRAALDVGDEPEAGATEAGLRRAAALSQFWIIRGHFTEGLARLEALLALPAASERGAARAKACHALGSLYYRHGDHAAGDFVKARAYYEESLGIFRELGEEPRVAVALADLGRVDADLGEYASARSLLEESLLLQRRLGNEHGVAVAQYGLGWLDFLRGEHAAARSLLEEGLAIFRKLGDKFHLGGCVLYLGCLDCEQGDYAAARSRFVELTGLVSFQHYRYVAPLVVEAFVILAATQGQAARALRMAGAATELRRVMGAQFRLGWQHYVRRQVASARRALGEDAGAAWVEGQKMTLEAALAYALEEPTMSRQETQDSPVRPATSLSARELEVLGLVAEGQTDARVAERLHLSPRTVGRHLESVYRKLGVSSRTAAARRAGELGLL